jgi:hypothetical protein
MVNKNMILKNKALRTSLKSINMLYEIIFGTLVVIYIVSTIVLLAYLMNDK